MTSNQTLGFTGNADIYGIGIRTGYYTQALAVWFSNFFLLSSARELRAVNALFLFALLVVGFIYARNARTTYAVEAFLLLQIGLCLALVSVMEGTRYSTRYLSGKGGQDWVRLLVVNAGMGFNVWFWWKGLDSLVRTPGGGTWACYFVRTDMYGWMRRAMEALALVTFVGRCLRNTLYDVAKAVQTVRLREYRANFVEEAARVGRVIDSKVKNTGSSTPHPIEKDMREGVGDGKVVITPKEETPQSRMATESQEKDEGIISPGTSSRGLVPSVKIQHDDFEKVSAESENCVPSSTAQPVLKPQPALQECLPIEIQGQSQNLAVTPGSNDNESKRHDAMENNEAGPTSGDNKNKIGYGIFQIFSFARKRAFKSDGFNSLASIKEENEKSIRADEQVSTAGSETVARKMASKISFEKIHEAERYIESVISIYDKGTALSKAERQFCTRGHLQFRMPCLGIACHPQVAADTRQNLSQSQTEGKASDIVEGEAIVSAESRTEKSVAPRLPRKTHPTSYSHCLYRTIQAEWTNEPNWGTRMSLSFHVTALQQHPVWRWPRFVDRMIRLDQTAKAPGWRALAIASDVQLSQIPLVITARIWTLMALQTFIVIVLLIVQVELTIRWNHVRGLQSLSTLGQLIPFILGVGGLLKVLWGKWCLVRKGGDENRESDERHAGEYENAIKEYLKWKDGMKKQHALIGTGV